MSGHTKEPWGANKCREVLALSGRTICRAHLDATTRSEAESEANARRIVSCVNALAGIPDPAAYVAAFEAMREALAEYQEAPFRSADWLANRMLDIFNNNQAKGGETWSTTAASIFDANRLAELLKAVSVADLTSSALRVAKDDLADFVISNSASIATFTARAAMGDAA